MIKPYPEGYFPEQNAYSNQIEKLSEDFEFDSLRANSHRLPLITQTRPEILAGANILSQITKETHIKEDTNTINSLIKHARKYHKVLGYVKSWKESLKIVVYSDESFTTNKDGTFQVWYFIFMAYKNKKANLIGYASTKSIRVVLSFLVAATLGLLDACDSAIVIQHDLRESQVKKLKMQILTDIETLYNVIIMNA